MKHVIWSPALKGLLGPFKGLISPFKGLIRPLKALIRHPRAPRVSQGNPGGSQELPEFPGAPGGLFKGLYKAAYKALGLIRPLKAL